MFISTDALLGHWQGHRRLTRRVIEMFPDDQLFTFSIGGMRTFGDLANELLSTAGPMAHGLATLEWGGYAPPKSTSKAEILRLWDEGTTADAESPRAERRRASVPGRAFTTLPPVHQRVLRERLRRISFLDGMPNTALTSTVDPDAPAPVYDLTIRAGVLHENVSELLTNKERTCFDFDGSARTVVIGAGTLEAIV